jgi:hypothetical protein
LKAPILEPIVLGHNAFFGVDHLSADRGAERAAYFAQPSRVVDVIRAAVDAGAGAMMMSTHERAGPLSEAIASNAGLRDRLAIYPLLPYAQKFVTRANEVGMINVVMDMISGTSIAEKSKMIWSGGKAVLKRDAFSVLSMLIQVELKVFSKLNMPVVFLHDALTDLALCFGLKDIFAFYIEEIDRLYSAQGAFATKNLPMLLARFHEWGMATPVVMTHFNAAGFHMNPDREACERAIEEHEVNVMAMGTLASGYLTPSEAYPYLRQFRNIRSVVVGVSSPQHVAETFGAIQASLFNEPSGST